MKKVLMGCAAILLVGFVGTAMAAKFEFHGDLNNRFMVYTDQATWFQSDSKGTTSKEKSEDTWGEIKYRLWVNAATDDDMIKGVYAIEIGAVRFGRSGSGKSQGGAFSGDGVNIETRWAYTDFALPATDGRMKVGLMPVSVNNFFWNETAMGVFYNQGGLALGWARGSEALTTAGQDWGEGDLDALIARYTFKNDGLNVGLLGTYMGQTSSDDFADYSSFDPIADYQIKSLPKTDFYLTALGVDGGMTIPTGFGEAFINWDAIYQFGKFNDVSFDVERDEDGNVISAPKDDYDLKAYLIHLDAGVAMGQTRLTYTFWYASGDDNETDTDLDGYISVDLDRFDSIIFMEGGYTDDNYFTERPHIGDKGMVLNKLAVDYKATEKTKVGAAALYLMTAEDLVYVDDGGVARADDKLGFELDAYVSHQLFPSCEVALNAGYLWADDAMDFFEVERDGKADNDIFRSTARIRYKF